MTFHTMYVLSSDGVVHPHMDWCFGESGRSPREAPYGYDAHFAWRHFDKRNPPANMHSVYSDRMQQWDPEKFALARKAAGENCWIENLTPDAARRFVEVYYDGTQECIGFGRCCNQATGYGIGLFYIRPKP